MIVKAQISLETSETVKQVLIYNQDRSVCFEMDAPPAVLDAMADRRKAFFHAELRDDGKLELLEVAPWQEW